MFPKTYLQLNNERTTETELTVERQLMVQNMRILQTQHRLIDCHNQKTSVDQPLSFEDGKYIMEKDAEKE